MSRMSKFKLGLLLGSCVICACDAGEISEPGPSTLEETQDDAPAADLASNELRFRHIAGAGAQMTKEDLQRGVGSRNSFWSWWWHWPRRGGNAGSGGSTSMGGSGGSTSMGGSGAAGSGMSDGGSGDSTGSVGRGGRGGRGGTGGVGGMDGKGGKGGKGGVGGVGGVGGTGGKGGSGGAGGTGGTGAAGSGGVGGTGGTGAAGSGGGIGTGDIDHPVSGPAPTDASRFGGAPFVLVKNWDFGANGTVKNISDLSGEFEYHDQFGTIANGTHYGAVIVAPSSATAISAGNLGLPNDRQPVEDPSRPYREFTGSTLKTYVRPLDPRASTVSVSAHNTGCGSFMAKWRLPSGGERLGNDLVWETRVRIPTPIPAYWFALWTAGNQWDRGAEMDVVEAFGAPHIFANAFHSDSVGGSNKVNYSSWPNALTQQGVPEGAARDLREWHIWTWIYKTDNSYEVYYDGRRVQYGAIEWTNGGTANGTPIDMRFLFDFGWGHTDISDVNISLPASQFPMVFEIDYSRVYLR